MGELLQRIFRIALFLTAAMVPVAVIAEPAAGLAADTTGHQLISTRIDAGGWQLLSVPGRLTEDQTSLLRDIPNLNPGEALPLFIPANDTIALKVTQIPSGRIERQISEQKGEWLLVGNPFVEPLPLSAIRTGGGSLSGYGFQAWDAQEGTFRILDDRDMLEPWQALAVRNLDAEMLWMEPTLSEYSIVREEPVPAIRFTLLHDRLVDRAAILEFRQDGSHGPDSLEAEKLWPFFEMGPGNNASILFFRNGTESRLRLLSREIRPFELERSVEVGLGHLHTGIQGEHRLQWEGPADLPPQWEITLTDLESGDRVNMREVDEFRFMPGSAVRLDRTESASPTLQGVHPGLSESARFRLEIDPGRMPSLLTSHEEITDKVELFPNYPNPFTTTTNVVFALPEEMPVDLSVFNIVGQRVGLLMDGMGSEGRNELVWDATEMPSGIYILRLETPAGIHTRKVTLIR